MAPVSATAIALLLIMTGMVDHAGSEQKSEPAPQVSETYLVHTPCVYVNPGGQWRCPPGVQPPTLP
jgi:hypothetical protein